jgi:hypothetical protein
MWIKVEEVIGLSADKVVRGRRSATVNQGQSIIKGESAQIIIIPSDSDTLWKTQSSLDSFSVGGSHTTDA